MRNASEKNLQEDVFGWKIGGYFILTLLKGRIVPEDIEDNQKKVALMWAYRQLADEKIVSLNDLLKGILDNIVYIYDSGKDSMSLYTLTDTVFALSRFGRFLYNLYVDIYDYSGAERKISRRRMVENFFQWNRFIRDGKRDINAVVDFDELHELVEEARPLYQDWQEKQLQKDSKAGQELLLDDDKWQVIAIHNKGAACELGKGTDWCTAAPGLEYFKKYYRPDDPLFYVLDKSDGERYQFHFGTQQFMDKDDSNLYPSRYHVGDEIMTVLAKVVPAKYKIARKFLDGLSLL